MEKQFITYEIAIELEKLGFDEICLGYYEQYLKDSKIEFKLGKNKRTDGYFINAEIIKHCSAPLWQQVIDWFREKKNIVIQISTYSMSTEPNNFVDWIYGVYPLKSTVDISTNNYYKCREQAILKAIELCQKQKMPS